MEESPERSWPFSPLDVPRKPGATLGELRALAQALRSLLASEPAPACDERLFVLVRDLVELLTLHLDAVEHADAATARQGSVP